MSATELFLALTAIGRADSRQQLVLRSTAKPGDLIGVTGELGGAAAGLALLDGTAADGGGEVEARLRERYLRPLPQLDCGRALSDAGVSAMLDVSDGVASDGRRLAEASGVAVEIELAELPLQQGVAELAQALGRSPAELGATGGEDYELLFSCSPSARERVELASNSTRTRLTWIGRSHRRGRCQAAGRRWLRDTPDGLGPPAIGSGDRASSERASLAMIAAATRFVSTS